MKLHERGLAMSKILIVEDEESIADIEKDYLELTTIVRVDEPRRVQDRDAVLERKPAAWLHVSGIPARDLYCQSRGNDCACARRNADVRRAH